MAVTYKDIDQLTAKASAVGTEKIVVSDTEYITPRMLAGRITGFVASNVDAGTTQYVIAKTNLAAENSHRFVFEVIGNSYDGNGPIHSVIQAVNTPSQSAFVSGWTQAVNMGKPHTYYVANINGYVCLYFQIIAGVSVWVSCHSGGNLDNRVTEVTMQDSAPTYTWRATATNTNLSGFLPLAGGTMTGAVTFNNGANIKYKDTGGTERVVLGYSTSVNNLLIGYGTATAGHTTNLDGNIINLRYGTSHTTGFTLDSSGNCTAVGSVTASSFVKSGGTSSQYLRADGSVGTITISSSDPTSSQGENGDIWIKI